MSVRSDTIRATLSDGRKIEHQKPVYLCEECSARASYGITVTDGPGKRKRKWYCGFRDGSPVCKGKSNGQDRTDQSGGYDGNGDPHREASEGQDLFG